MSTINQHISNIRGLIKEHSRNPEVYTDQFLYQLLNGARARLLEINANKINHNSEWDWETFPIFLTKKKSHLVGCIQVGCDVMRSEYKLPRALLVNNKSMIEVYGFDWKPIILASEIDWLNTKYDDVRSKYINASIINDYLVIWNKLNLKAVLVKGLWEDVSEWAQIPQCNEDGDIVAPTCFDIYTKDFPLSESMKDAAYDIVLSKLGFTKKLMADTTNDSNNEIKV